MFSGRSGVGTAGSNSPESPKTPRAAPGLQNLHLPSTRIVIPYLNRTYSQNTTPAASPRSSRHPYTSIDSRSITPQSSRQQTEPGAVSRPSQSRQNSQRARRFVGVDPAELHLAELAEAGRRRRRQKSRAPERKCFPQIKNRKIRSKILSCFISGLVRNPSCSRNLSA